MHPHKYIVACEETQKNEFPIFVLMYVLCFQRQPFRLFLLYRVYDFLKNDFGMLTSDSFNVYTFAYYNTDHEQIL